MGKSFNEVLTGEFAVPNEKQPSELLHELASSLEKKMQYKLVVRVHSTTELDQALHSLRVTVPSLDYVLELLTVSHPVLQSYPARISGLLRRLGVARNEDELFAQLVTIFNGAKAKEILGALLAQSKN